MQAAKAAPSTRQRNVEPEIDDLNENSGVVSHVSPVGPSVIVVSGTASTWNVTFAGIPALPVPSIPAE